MKFRTHAPVPGSGQWAEVELTDEDMADQEGWAELPVVDRFRSMSRRADTLVVEYLARNEHISPEFAAQRMREIRGNA